MSKTTFELHVEQRQEKGKGASRRLRRQQNQVPGILYGGDKPAMPIVLDQEKLFHALENKAFYSRILTLHFPNAKEQVILKDLQRHPYKKAINHVDFLRVKATDKIHLHIPIRFLGEALCPGAKAGGIISRNLIDIEVRCQANAIPEVIEVDISTMELNDSIHLADLKLPNGVEIPALAKGPEQNQAIVSIHPPQKVEEDTPIVAPETEVIAKGKEATASGEEKDKAKGK